MIVSCILGANTKSDDIFVVDWGRHHVIWPCMLASAYLHLKSSSKQMGSDQNTIFLSGVILYPCQKLDIIFACHCTYVPMSSSVAFWAQTQNLMTYLSLTEAGTIWSLPDALMVDNSFWFSSSEPRSLKQTNPSYIKKEKKIDMKFDLRIQTT